MRVRVLIFGLEAATKTSTHPHNHTSRNLVDRRPHVFESIAAVGIHADGVALTGPAKGQEDGHDALPPLYNW